MTFKRFLTAWAVCAIGATGCMQTSRDESRGGAGPGNFAPGSATPANASTLPDPPKHDVATDITPAAGGGGGTFGGPDGFGGPGKTFPGTIGGQGGEGGGFGGSGGAGGEGGAGGGATSERV